MRQNTNVIAIQQDADVLTGKLFRYTRLNPGTLAWMQPKTLSRKKQTKRKHKKAPLKSRKLQRLSVEQNKRKSTDADPSMCAAARGPCAHQLRHRRLGRHHTWPPICSTGHREESWDEQCAPHESIHKDTIDHRKTH